MIWIPMAVGAALGAINAQNQKNANNEQREKEAVFRKKAIEMSPWTGMKDPGMQTPVSNQTVLGGALQGGATGAMLGGAMGLGGAAAGAGSALQMGAGQASAGGAADALGGSAPAMGGGAPATMTAAAEAPPMAAPGSPGALGASMDGGAQQMAMQKPPANMMEALGQKNPYDPDNLYGGGNMWSKMLGKA